MYDKIIEISLLLLASYQTPVLLLLTANGLNCEGVEILCIPHQIFLEKPVRIRIDLESRSSSRARSSGLSRCLSAVVVRALISFACGPDATGEEKRKMETREREREKERSRICTPCIIINRPGANRGGREDNKKKAGNESTGGKTRESI